MSTGRELAADAAAHLRHPLTLALLSLTFATGMFDAVSFLALGHVFAGNMTGNVVLLGFGIAGARGLPVIAPVVSLAAFVLGAGVGGILARRLLPRPRAHLGTAVVIELALTLSALVILLAADVRPASFAADTVIALLAFGIGLRNATVRKIAVPNLSTTVLTTTITAFASEFAPVRGTRGGADTARRFAAVVAMFAGAIVGAALVQSSAALAVGCGAAVLGWTLVAYVRVRWRAAGQPA